MVLKILKGLKKLVNLHEYKKEFFLFDMPLTIVPSNKGGAAIYTLNDLKCLDRQAWANSAEP